MSAGTGTEGREEDAMTLKEIFTQFAGEQKLPFVELTLEPEAPNQLCICLNGKNGNFEGHALFLEEEKLFLFYVPLGVRVPEEKREKLAWYLMRLNYRLKLGGIFVEEATGELTARVSHYMAGADWEKKEMMEQLITGCGRTADHYYPEIMRELFG